jgi:hypothetical protein
MADYEAVSLPEAAWLVFMLRGALAVGRTSGRATA